MIPQTINYCWFGKAGKPKQVIKCIDSWKKYCPGFEIIEWNESNIDIKAYPYAAKAYEMKKWAFVTDYIRMHIIYNNGGVYFDTDVELVKPLDDIIQYDAFFGFECNDRVASGLGFGSISQNPIFKEIIDYYNSIDIYDEHFRFVACPQIETEVFQRHGLLTDGSRQSINSTEVFPPDFFSPYDYSTGRLNITENTISIHHYDGTWKTKKELLNTKIHRILNRFINN